MTLRAKGGELVNFVEALNTVAKLIALAICLVERPKDGAKKKQEVKEMVYSFLKQFNIKLPMPQFVFDWMLDIAIDNIVKYFNQTIWKEKAA
jgi:hypothetical protein